MEGMSLFFGNRLNRFKMKPDDDKGGGGGGGNPPPDDKNKPDPIKELNDVKAQNAALLARLEKLEKGGNPPPDDKDLEAKARERREAEEKNKNNTKALEAAMRFDMGADSFLKDNEALLPKDVKDIFAQANKENYNSQIEKAAAVKAGVIKSFFSVQENLDLLTPGLKSQLEDYLKLTNTGRAEKAAQIWDNIFEPSFEMLRKLRKANALKHGHNTNSDDEYKNKLIAGSRKHFLGEK